MAYDSPKSPPETPVRSNTPVQNGPSTAPQDHVDKKDLPNGEKDEHTASAKATEQTTNKDTPSETADPSPSSNADEAAGTKPEASPSHNVPAFNWEEFEHRYAAATKTADAQEEALLEQFDDLVDFFGHWATAASKHDDDRAIKRLKTREFYVQNREAELEKKKQHYTKVVDAFQQAIALLDERVSQL